jgi:hypothetical protein
MIIPPGWNLPGPVRARLSDKTFGRQRIIFEEGHLLLILHRPPAADDSQREGVLFWRTPDGIWKWTRGSNGGPALAAHVQSYIDCEAALSSACDKAEDAASLYELLASLAPLARSARNMHSALQAARDAVKTEKLLIELRDRAYETERNLELLQEDVRNMIQYRGAREAEEQSRMAAEALRASHRLNIMAALFLPLSAITGLFAMNPAAGFDPATAIYFWLIFVISIALGVALKNWVVAHKETSVRPKTPPKMPSLAKL